MMEQDFFNTDGAFLEEAPNENPNPPKAKPFNMASAIRDYRLNGATTIVERAVSQAIESIETFVRKVVNRVVHFAKEALEIAVSKFLVELCAMVIAAVCKALMSKHGKPMDITTSGVFWSGSGNSSPSSGPAPSSGSSSSSGQQQSMWAGSAFDSGWSSERRNAW